MLKLSFQKNEVVSGKHPFFEMGPFRTPHSICLNFDREILTFDREILSGNITL